MTGEHPPGCSLFLYLGVESTPCLIVEGVQKEKKGLNHDRRGDNGKLKGCDGYELVGMDPPDPRCIAVAIIRNHFYNQTDHYHIPLSRK
jgi:hypothetical protein